MLFRSPGNLGALTITANGAYQYSVDNAAVQYLTQGQTKAETFTVYSLDGTPKVLTFTINGTNDAPTLVASAASATLIEAGGVGNATSGTSSAAIALTRGDVDGTATFDTNWLVRSETSATNPGGGWTTTNGGVSYTKVGTFGTATLTISSGSVTYALNNNANATQALAASQNASDSFAIRVTDGSATTVTNAVFRVVGSNDAPRVAAALTSTAAEGVAPYTLDLLNGAIDVDAGATLTVGSLTYTVAGVATGNNGGDLPDGVTLTNGFLRVDPSHANFNSLAVGQTKTIVASYVITDNNGASVNQTQTIAITGTNDAPTVATVGLTSAAASEGSAAYTLNLLAGASDVDTGTVLSVSNPTYTVEQRHSYQLSLRSRQHLAPRLERQQ